MKRLYSIEEAAEYLGRSAEAVRELIYRGRIPAVKIDRRTQVDVRDLEKLVQHCKETREAAR